MRTASLLALFGIVKREREALVIGASGMGTFHNCRSIVDGNGVTLIAGRRDDTRAIAKLSLFPNLFNINETAVFGMPVVLNPPMAWASSWHRWLATSPATCSRLSASAL